MSHQLFRAAYIFSDKAKAFLNFIRFSKEPNTPQNNTVLTFLIAFITPKNVKLHPAYLHTLEVKLFQKSLIFVSLY